MTIIFGTSGEDENDPDRRKPPYEQATLLPDHGQEG